ncbi:MULTISPECIES: efflux RND transporter periplasmic adaptor subunit [unclassified Herbaspirillum]|uniref:efflux RND transporter periplasmic adaptor subunit n=1 Tax=unclassified Herbaspirillum TaxID=2624150 RepID=UPI001154E597|nr:MULTISPECIES: efflux RND transporter periplasmic adaptor subunit [unclassified Herbaspirillum]MBB5393206.1 RND family efflux transporter MFP subunit [Herbaspirillum sp. SJZ102]TQK04155.1 RND family efflux transporter MFP subunit [Herbaspirillum sp. SJZ130]TQK10060.1 RND family efflux transporter MFP subunit [Herbaspirillum sp. SJZ106]TWC63631.1 RND family efflux transporter MFP subunit [Herbaspirillum sp. SJZ099]
MLRRRLAISLVLCTLPLALAACADKKTNDPRTEVPRVRIAVVGEASLPAREFTGVVAARVQSDLGFRVPGKVVERLVDAGQAVKRGQLLMRIDPVDLNLGASAQREAVAAARARARQAADDEARYRDLRGTGAISESSYDQIKAAADAAKAQLIAAEAQADVARNASRYAELVADSDGIVMETVAEPGQVVSAGQVVVRLARNGSREALIQLPETMRPKLGSIASATLFGAEQVTMSAHLRQLSNTADRMTRTFEARYLLDAGQASLPLGATVTVRIPESEEQQAGMQVPIGALFDQGQGAGVWVVQGEPGKASWRPVSVLRLNEDSASVSGSLKRGDRIVALGAHLLREGQAVRIAAATTEGARP